MSNINDILGPKIRDIKLKKDMKVSELIEAMSDIGGFSGEHLVEGVDILKRMLNDEKSFNFLSFPADIVATGLRGALASAVKYFDAIITTGGMFDHDIARAFGGIYSKGTFNVDDSYLHKKGVYRLGNVFIEKDEYGLKVEDAFNEIIKEFFDEKTKNEFSASELAYEFGKRIKDEGSILRQAYLNNVPIFSPGILDGSFGTQLTLFAQDHNLKLNLIKDELKLSNIPFDNKVTGALMIGGGISKHHVIWWNQFKGGLDYAVYITTASQYDGSLSGARMTEAVSWGKVKEKAKYTTIDGDATIILPIMLAALNIV
ncbi:MAG: deoxyhypusine synthase [Candidatus Micrarchaeia archaeon]